MALYLFSDAHLGCGTESQELEKVAKIAELVELVKQDGDRLVILGDLFDFWFEYKHAIPKEHTDVLFMLRELVRAGIRIDYVSGNHDFWMDDYFEKQIGVQVHRDSFDTEYAGNRMHLIHGDGLAPGDGGYRLLKKVLRGSLNIRLYRKLPPDWAIPLAKWVSGSSRKHTAKRDLTFAPDYADYARRKLADGFDIVAIGHLHLPVREEFDEGVYVNTGDFINHFSYVRVDGDGAQLLTVE